MTASTPRRHEWVAIAALLLTAVAIRLPLVADLPPEFATMRQYRSGMIARAMYARMDADAMTAARRTAAIDYVAQATIPEPIIAERIAAAVYGLSGEERLWIPRALSALYWCAAALFLYGCGRAIAGSAGGLIAAAVHLFLPYSIGASLSFQPDALAVLLMSGSLWGLARHAMDDGASRLAAPVVFAALAILVRPMTGCFIVPAMAVAVWHTRPEAPRVARLRRVIPVLAMSVLPAAGYYLYWFLTDATVNARVGATFAPALFADPAFWRGWARFAWMAFGPVLFVGAFVGAAVFARGRVREMLLSLWLGYALYGATFNLHMSTHPYYQTLAMPMIALSLAPIAAAFARGRRAAELAVPGLAAALLLAVAMYQGALAPTRNPGQVAAYEAIGRATGHSRRVIFLTDNWGAPLRYHADIGGRYWPTRFEVIMYKPLGAGGIPDLSAADRLREFQSIVGAEFFAVTDFAEFARQADLRDVLERDARVVERTDTYVVYELPR